MSTTIDVVKEFDLKERTIKKGEFLFIRWGRSYSRWPQIAMRDIKVLEYTSRRVNWIFTPDYIIDQLLILEKY